jgi:hypothetical protein
MKENPLEMKEYPLESRDHKATIHSQMIRVLLFFTKVEI